MLRKWSVCVICASPCRLAPHRFQRCVSQSGHWWHENGEITHHYAIVHSSLYLPFDVHTIVLAYCLSVFKCNRRFSASRSYPSIIINQDNDTSTQVRTSLWFHLFHIAALAISYNEDEADLRVYWCHCLGYLLRGRWYHNIPQVCIPFYNRRAIWIRER